MYDNDELLMLILDDDLFPVDEGEEPCGNTLILIQLEAER